MDSKSLKEEYQALLSDKDGEAEYLQSLQLQIAKLMVLRNIHAFPERWYVIQLVVAILDFKEILNIPIYGVNLSIYFSISLSNSYFAFRGFPTVSNVLVERSSR